MLKNNYSGNSQSILFGIIVMLLGIFFFAGNDALGKTLVATFTVGQVLLLRSIGALFLLVPMVTRLEIKELVKPCKPWLQFSRALAATVDTGIFYAAVMYLPLTNVMTFYMAGPIYITIISHFFLNEKIEWQRLVAIFVGFIGVLIALRPEPGILLSWPSLFALIGSVAFSFVMLFNRALKTTHDATLVTWQVGAALFIGALFCLWDFHYGGWVTPDSNQWFLLCLLGIVSTLGHMLIARSLKMASASVLAPLQYTMLLWAIIFDYFIFNHKPDLQVLIGATIIILAGLYIFLGKKNNLSKTKFQNPII